MRKTLLILAITIFVITPFRVSSQRYKNKEISLISFNVTIHSEVKKYLDQYENSFSSVKNAKADKIIAKIKEQAWGSFVDVLQREIGMIILPVSTFGNSISYDDYGFPDVNISKAQRKGFSKYYMKIDMQIGPEMPQFPISHKAKNDSTVQSTLLKDGEIKPVVTITLTTFPENGIMPLSKFVGIAESPAAWSSDDPLVLDGLINDNNKTDLSTLMSLINEAITDLSINMLIK